MSDHELSSLFQKVINGLRKNYNIKEEAIKAAIEVLVAELSARSWSSDEEAPNPFNFNRMEMCCAYLHRYATCHAELTRQSVHHFLSSGRPPRVQCPPDGELRLVSVGGGPGNDLLGACYALMPLVRGVRKLHLGLVDCMQGWCAAFKSTLGILEESPTLSLLGRWLATLQVSDSFLCADVLDPAALPALRRELGRAHIVLMVKFLSLMSKEKKRRVVEVVLALMSPEALLVCVDSDWPCRTMEQIGDLCDVVFLSTGGACEVTPREGFHYRSIKRSQGDVVVVKKKTPHHQRATARAAAPGDYGAAGPAPAHHGAVGQTAGNNSDVGDYGAVGAAAGDYGAVGAAAGYFDRLGLRK